MGKPPTNFTGKTATRGGTSGTGRPRIPRGVRTNTGGGNKGTPLGGKPMYVIQGKGGT